MNTMLDTIVPKSDQLNADDLIGGRTMTITITNVGIKMDEQPVSIHFDGDNGKPYKPGKSMRRVLVQVWGPDAKAYVGRKLTLYRDDRVKFGGLDVGGIRISHMSHITAPVTMALTATKAQRRPFTVQPLAEQKQEPATQKKGLTQWFTELESELLEVSADDGAVMAIIQRDETQRALSTLKNGALDRLHKLLKSYKPDWVAPGEEPSSNPITTFLERLDGMTLEQVNALDGDNDHWAWVRSLAESDQTAVKSAISGRKKELKAA